MRQDEEDDIRLQQEQQQEQKRLRELELARLEAKCFTGMIDRKPS